MKLLHAFSQMLYRRTGLVPVAVAAVIYLVFAVSILGVAGEKLDQLSGYDTKVPDLQFFGYSADQLYTLLDRMGEAGLVQYIHIESIVDIIYPIIYTAMFLLALSWGWREQWQHSPRSLWNLLPFSILLFDFSENLTILRVIHFLPKHYDHLAQAASFFTVCKWASLAVCAFLALTGLWRLMLEKKK